jgi:hypothetical protein
VFQRNTRIVAKLPTPQQAEIRVRGAQGVASSVPCTRRAKSASEEDCRLATRASRKSWTPCESSPFLGVCSWLCDPCCLLSLTCASRSGLIPDSDSTCARRKPCERCCVNRLGKYVGGSTSCSRSFLSEHTVGTDEQQVYYECNTCPVGVQ